MSNEYYSETGSPATSSALSSATIRAEFVAIGDGFDKLPTLTGNGSKIIAVNSGATALEAVTTTGTGNAVRATSPTLVTPILGTPTSGTLTNCTGLPVATGISGLGTGVATALAIAVGSAGAFVTFNGALGTPSSGTLTNATGLPISTGVSGLGTGVATALAVNVGSSGAFVTNGGALGSPSSAGTMPAFTLGGTLTLNGQSFSGTCANGGTFTTIDINGGTLDGVVIGGSSAAAATVTTLTASGAITKSGATESDSITNTIYLQNAGGTRAANLQLTAAGTLGIWHYNGSAWAKTIDASNGAVAVTGTLSATSDISGARGLYSGGLRFNGSSSIALSSNYDINIYAVSDTVLRFAMRGSDGVTRTYDMTLS